MRRSGEPIRGNGERRTSSRRRFLKLAGAGSTMALAGCMGTNGGGDIELLIAGFGGSWGEWNNEYYLDPWSEETGYSYEKQDLGDLNLLQELRANQDNPQIHAAEVSTILAAKGGELGVMRSIEGEIDGADRIIEAGKHAHTLNQSISPWGIGWNTDAVDIEVNSWNSLLEPQFEGKVAMPAWGWQGVNWLYGLSYSLGGDIEDVDAAFSFIEEMVENLDPVIMNGPDHGVELFRNEDIIIAPFWSNRTTQVRLNTEINTGFVVPEEGTFPTGYGYSVVSGHDEEHTEAAKSLLDFTTQAEAQANFVTEGGDPPSNPDAKDHIDQEVLEKRPMLDMSEETAERLAKNDVPWERQPEVNDEHSRRWRQIVQN